MVDYGWLLRILIGLMGVLLIYDENPRGPMNPRISKSWIDDVGLLILKICELIIFYV